MDFEKYTFIKVETFLTHKIDDVKDVLLKGYDRLNMYVSNSKSISNIEIYRDTFENSVNSFIYLEKEDQNLVFNVPDIESFDFSELNIIKQILEGTTGNYVEILDKDLIKIDKKLLLNKEQVNLPNGKTFYLIRYNSYIKGAEKHILGKKLVKFPFSNTPPLYEMVFGPVTNYVDRNIDKWIDDCLEENV